MQNGSLHPFTPALQSARSALRAGSADDRSFTIGRPTPALRLNRRPRSSYRLTGRRRLLGHRDCIRPPTGPQPASGLGDVAIVLIWLWARGASPWSSSNRRRVLPAS